MSRRSSSLAGVTALLLVLTACGGQPSERQDSESGRTAAAASPSRPNIVLLMTDDQAAGDLSVMPRTRRLIGAQGATFNRAISSYPLCCPARTTVLSGEHAHNHGVLGNEAPWGGYAKYQDERDSLPVWLNRAGYQTIMLGKHLNGYPKAGKRTYVPPGWSKWYVPVKGAYNYKRFLVNENGKLKRYKQYQSTYIAQRASKIISSADRRRPFFLWANFLAPHDGAPHEPDDPSTAKYKVLKTPHVEARFRNTMRGARLPHAAAVNEKDMRDKAPFMRQRRVLPRAAMREVYQQRLESLRSVDVAVARIVRELSRTGQLRNTLLVFVSDNGFMSGQHRWHHKILGYEESIRIPMLMRGPGIRAGTRVDQQVSLVDLAATIVRTAGATPGHALDGVPLVPLANQPALLRNRAMLLEAGGWPFPSKTRLYTGVRTADNWVMLRWYDGTREVYDLNKDPLQLDGTISSAERSRVPALQQALNQLTACKGNACNTATGR